MAEINATQAEINSELDKVKTPKLSLDAEEKSVDTGFAIPSMAAMSVPQESNVAAGSMNESMLSEEELIDLLAFLFAQHERIHAERRGTQADR